MFFPNPLARKRYVLDTERLVTVDEDSKLRLTQEWADHLEELRRVSERLRAYLEFVCAKLEFESYTPAGPDFRVRFVDRLRIKEPASILRKLATRRRFKSLWAIDDMIGLRVIVVSPSDADKLAKTIVVDTGCPFEVEDRICRCLQLPSGYRATHITGRCLASFAKIGCEIQIRTALQDLWAVISRLDLYQREGTESLPSRARILSDKLAEIDAELQAVRDEAWRIRADADQLKVVDQPLASPNAQDRSELLPRMASDSQSEKMDANDNGR